MSTKICVRFFGRRRCPLEPALSSVRRLHPLSAIEPVLRYPNETRPDVIVDPVAQPGQDVGHHFAASRWAALLWQHRLWRCVLVMFVLASLVASAWLMREYLLVGAAEVWIVSDPVSRANAVVVLGGGPEIRPFAAAELWRRGLADKILISQGSEEVLPSHSELQILLKLGVPAGAIETFGTASRNTRDEAVALREWADRNGASVFIIPSEIFPARRVRWIFCHEFSGTTVRIEVPSFEPPRYTRWDWWKTEEGLIAFQNELMKYIYYRWKY